MSVSSDESAAIISRMHELRSAGRKDVNQLHAQVERVTDWREHVRAHPVASAAAASLVGFVVVRKLAGSETSSPQVLYASPGTVVKQKSATTGLLSVAGGMAVSFARQWLTEYIKKQIGVHTNATNQPTHPGQRAHSSP